jgi:hypothetical protein
MACRTCRILGFPLSTPGETNFPLQAQCGLLVQPRISLAQAHGRMKWIAMLAQCKEVRRAMCQC